MSNQSIEVVALSSYPMAIEGWVEVKLSIYGMGCFLTRLCVGTCMFDRAISVVLGTQQVKKIYSQATAIKAA